MEVGNITLIRSNHLQQVMRAKTKNTENVATTKTKAFVRVCVGPHLSLGEGL